MNIFNFPRGILLCLAFAAVFAVHAGEPVLRIGVSSNYPPVVFSVDGVHAGIEIDLARQLGHEMQREVEFVEIGWEQQIPSLREGRTDIVMSGMSVTTERAEQVAFAIPYMTIGQMALVRLEHVARYNRPASLLRTNSRVGVVTGTTGARFVQKSMPRSQSVGFRTTEEGVSALRRGDIEIFIHDAPTAWTIGGNPAEEELVGLYWPLTEEPLAWALRHQDQELLLEVNDILTEWKRNGFLRKVLNRWIPTRVEVK